MKIYTKTGDDGTTGLFGGARVGKDDALVEAYGTVDETNAALGLARSAGLPAALDGLLESIQKDLFVLGAELACVPGKQDKLKMDLIDDTHVAALEVAIDTHEAALEALKSFILPGGTPGAAALHFARTVCRRAERRALLASRGEGVRSELLVYLNRLSDLLFVLARRANHDAAVADVPWVARASDPKH
jgi:cob(I)alamin adenosyltransferase